jgi:hypothetical protein
VTPDYLVCLEDGVRMTMLRRHLRTAHGLTPEEYRAEWGVSRDYPMAIALPPSIPWEHGVRLWTKHLALKHCVEHAGQY